MIRQKSDIDHSKPETSSDVKSSQNDEQINEQCSSQQDVQHFENNDDLNEVDERKLNDSNEVNNK